MVNTYIPVFILFGHDFDHRIFQVWCCIGTGQTHAFVVEREFFNDSVGYRIHNRDNRQLPQFQKQHSATCAFEKTELAVPLKTQNPLFANETVLGDIIISLTVQIRLKWGNFHREKSETKNRTKKINLFQLVCIFGLGTAWEQ